ncbi:MAG TPA: hypothetical protein VF169_15085 [Albitalea sp.]|uniref:hypothetical protein n=1 Tax=Piscinibacter sp. TaxID=1903157 RepID=UPI002ED0D1B7
MKRDTTRLAATRWCTVLLASSLAAGCSSMEQTVAQLKDGIATAVSQPPAAAQPTAQPGDHGISSTELDGIFKKFPITSSQQPQQFPRAAITITSATPSIFRGNAPRGDECITFDVRLWTSSTQSKSFKDLKMCAAQRSKDVPFVSLNIWPGQSGALQNTGAVRGEGPQRPATNFPPDPAVVSAWFDRPSRGIYFIGSILYQMGYEWTQPGETRAWFVSAPKS